MAKYICEGGVEEGGGSGVGDADSTSEEGRCELYTWNLVDGYIDDDHCQMISYGYPLSLRF